MEEPQKLSSLEESSQEEKTSKEEDKLKCTFYIRLRALIVNDKLFGACPLNNVFQRDGRKLGYKWYYPIHIWDILNCFVFLYSLTLACRNIKENIEPGKEERGLRMWLTLTYYVVIVRTIIQFTLVQVYAPRLPKLFAAFEEYWQDIGRDIVKCKEHRTIDSLLMLMETFLIFSTLFTVSYLFFKQFNPDPDLAVTMTMAFTYTGANLWNALPMNMFINFCKLLYFRLREVRAGVRQVRENKTDVAMKLEDLRIQHAALLRIVGLLQGCFGMQIAVTTVSILADTTLQLFVFFALTYSENLMLLLMAFYYVICCSLILVVVEMLQRTDGGILSEIAQFRVNSASHDQQLQVQLFTAQLTAKPLRLSASGFFDVNNAMLCTILGAVSSYLVMMVQFAPYIEHNILNKTNHSPLQGHITLDL